MRIYRDTIKSFFITLAVIMVLGLLGFLIGSYLLSPKQNTGKRDVYAPKVDYPNGPIKLTYWRTVDGKEVFDPILDKWKSYHPNVTVEVVNIPLADYDKRLYDAATSGNMPDMFMLRSDWLPRYKNFTSDAPDSVFTPEKYKKTFAPVVVNDLMLADKIKAVSYGVPTLGIFYNADMLNQARQILRQNKDSTAMKQLAKIGFKCITSQQNSIILETIFNNKRKNKTSGFVG